jgi:hypothetical protein
MRRVGEIAGVANLLLLTVRLPAGLGSKPGRRGNAWRCLPSPRTVEVSASGSVDRVTADARCG